MITAQHCFIRTADPDDALALERFYAPEKPRAAFLDRKRELLVPTFDELRELLSAKEAKAGVFYTVEDRAGTIRGFCSLRGAHPEVSHAEFVVVFADDADYDAPFADDVFEFLTDRAFVQLKLNKVLAQCLDSEAAFRAFLAARGFQSDGVQRDVLFAGGRWRRLESLSLFRSQFPPRNAGTR